MGSKTEVKPAHSPCKLVPPCRQGNHGSHILLEDGDHAARPIGKYFFTEYALKHDLAALKRGDIYDRDEFFKRAKAWYKAEIDRLLHLEKVKEEDSDAQSKATMASPAPNGEEDSELASKAVEPNQPSAAARSSPSKDGASPPMPPPPRRRTTKPPKPPTRIQPARAAKRKAADSVEPPLQAQQRKRKTPPSPPPPPPPTQPEQGPPPLPNLPAGEENDPPNRSLPAAGGTTKGDYALAAHDRAQFRNGNAGEHRPSPWSYVRLQGLDVAYFCMRLERAVARKVEEVAAAAAAAAAHMPVRSGGSSSCCCCCALGHGPGYEKPAPFEPAGALAPGEDWRPPGEAARGAAVRDVTDAVDQGTQGFAGKAGSWAADEVGRREKMNRKAGQAPEADMDLSPTMGRWPRRRASGPLPVVNVVEVSGLKFAVDLCASPCRTEKHARFLML